MRSDDGSRRQEERLSSWASSQHQNGQPIDNYSWWQWSRAERMWSGELAEAWRIGGHLIPYTIDNAGQWDSPEFPDLGDKLNRFCGDILHGDVYLIIWKTGLMQVTAHFKAAHGNPPANRRLRAGPPIGDGAATSLKK